MLDFKSGAQHFIEWTFVIVVFGCLFLLARLGETIHVAESIGRSERNSCA
jgi:hypothetical protein